MLCIINTIQASAIKYGEDGRSTSSWIATRISPAAEKLISSRSPEKVVGFVTRLSPAIPGIPRDETAGPQRQPRDVRRWLPVPPLDVHRHLVATGGHDAEHRVVGASDPDVTAAAAHEHGGDVAPSSPFVVVRAAKTDRPLLFRRQGPLTVVEARGHGAVDMCGARK